VCGRIEFAVGCDVTLEFKKAVLEVAEEDWVVLKKRTIRGVEGDGSAVGEVCYCPMRLDGAEGVEYRYWRFGADAGSTDAAGDGGGGKGASFRRCASRGEYKSLDCEQHGLGWAGAVGGITSAVAGVNRLTV